ncbi:hypothetical protein [Streptomyces sp. WM6378]|uniref:hypothetical protein n=1 Tax=Streptomyces sp. WM6378 TaxID=1415557 RepID=UPI002D21C053|nr:hypothetical protein [Streptomyces sp. WM6378]
MRRRRVRLTTAHLDDVTRRVPWATIKGSRSLLLQSMTGSGLTPTGLRVRREGDDTTELRAVVAAGGDPAQALEQLIARLSLEPGIHDLHWHLDATPTEAEQDAVA